MITMATKQSTTTRSGGDASSVLYRHRSAIAGVLAVGIVIGLLVWLESLSVPLAEAPVLRESGVAIVGGEMTYNAYEGLWLAVRALLGVYIVFVAVLISLFALASAREVMA